MLWKLGCKLPPPIFLGFRVNSFLFTTIFSVFYLFQVTPLVALSLVKHQGSVGLTITIATVLVLIQSFFFGGICALYLFHKARTMQLPKWEDCDPATSLLASGVFNAEKIKIQ